MQRPNTPNNTLFFWGFERENGSLTAAAGERSGEPWAIWLNGGYAVYLSRDSALANKSGVKPGIIEHVRDVLRGECVLAERDTVLLLTPGFP